MKLEKQEPCERPTAVSIPQSLAVLSPAHIAAMSERELREVLPELVATLQQELLPMRPDWWSDIPWTLHHLTRAVKSESISPASLRTLVTKCYSHLMQHTLNTAPSQPRVPTQPRVLDWLNSHPPSRSCTQPAKTNNISSPSEKGDMPCLEILHCYHCSHEFSTTDALQKHQVLCSAVLPLSIPSTPPASDAPSPVAPTVSDDTSSSGGASNTARPSSSAGTRKDFVTALDLVPVHRARKIRQARRRNTECETIDLEEPQALMSPPTPRTPKLLISQLSRDASANGVGGSPGATSRRRLSYLRHSMEKGEENEKEEDVDSDKDSAESGAEDPDEPKMHKKTLFSIDVTSGLGHRVLKHMTAECHVPVISNSEQFCRTPIKDKYQDRLRTRQLSYPITWKLTGKRLRQQAHCHLYNFTRGQKFEFMEKMRTGLNWRCRKLLRCVRRCGVVVKRLSRKTLHTWKPSLNKVAVPLKRLTAEEILYWTQPSSKTSLLPCDASLLMASMDLGFKSKDESSEEALTGGSTAKPNPLTQKIYRSHLAQLSRYGGPQSRMSLECNSVYGESTEAKKTYPTLLSILSGRPVDFKVPCPSKANGSGFLDVKKPLKIEIPSPGIGLAPPSTKSSRCSPLDDSFSIMTVSSSDEENIRSAACCSLCAQRNKCHCSPGKTPSVATSPSSRSPALTCKSSSHSVGSLLPPDLPSLSTTPLASVSSWASFSPPDLSPVSQSGWSCPRSPRLHPRLSIRGSGQSPKLSLDNHLKAPAGLADSRPVQCNRAMSSLTGKSSQPIRNGKEVMGEGCQTSVSPSSKASSQGIRNGKEMMRGEGEGSKISAWPSSKDLLQPVLLSQRPSTCSSSQESHGSKSSEDRPQQKAASRPFRHRDKHRTEVAGSADLPQVETELIMSRRVPGHTPFGTAALGSVHVRNDQDGLTQDIDCNSSQLRTFQTGKSSSDFSDRLQKMGEKKQNIGHNFCVIQNFSDLLHKVEERKKTNQASYGNSSTSKKAAKKISSKTDNGSRTLRSGRCVGRIQSDVESAAGSDGSGEHVHKNMWPGPADVQCKLGSSWGNLFSMSGEEENGVEASQGVNRSASGLMPAAHSETPDGSGHSSEHSSRQSSGHSSPSTGLDLNPFLISKAQAPLFSSSVLEQARRYWGPPTHKPPSGEVGALRSGNIFRFSNKTLGSSLQNLGASVSSKADGVEPALQPSRFQFVDSQNNMVNSKPCFFFPSGSPSQAGLQSPVRKRLSAMQMLSVLESVKGSSPSKSKAKGWKGSPGKSARHQNGRDHTLIKITSRGLGYHTRASESATSVGSLKKARFAE